MALLALFVTASTASAAAQQTYYIQQVNSRYFLHQTWHGNKDSKRNVTVWPRGQYDDSFRWILEPIGGGYYYLVNVKTHLVLTQDGNNDRNVSNWGRLGNNPRQHWKLVRGPNNLYMFVNRGTGMALTQHSGGRRDNKRNVTVWPGQNWRDTGWNWRLIAARRSNLIKMTLERVKCIKPSTGQDAGTAILFAGIELLLQTGLAAATGGGSAAAQGGAAVTRQAVIAAAKKAAKKRLKKGLKQHGKDFATQGAAALDEISLQNAFNKIYGSSPDDLEITLNAVSIWPNGGRDHRKTRSQQTHAINSTHIFEASKGMTLRLIEYDYGSGNDFMGGVSVRTQGMTCPRRYENVLISHKGEGSLYEVTFRLEPYGINNAQRRSCRLAEQRRLAAIRQREQAQQQQHQNANRPRPGRPQQGGTQYRVGEYVLVQRPADRRWTRSRVLATDPRNGFLVQYQDTQQRMWVSARIIRRQTQRAPQVTRPTRQTGQQFRVGEYVLVQRPADRRWIQSRVLGQDQRNGVLIQYQDTQQRMWVPTTIVRRGQMRQQPRPNNTGQAGVGGYQAGQLVFVLRPGGRQWIQSQVVSTHPRHGVMVRYLDNYQSMWVPPNIVRRQ